MEIKYSKKFVSQLNEYGHDSKLLSVIAHKIKHIKSASSPADIHELVKIRKTTSHYRLKIKFSEKRVYRLGIRILHGAVWFACIEKDKKRFYKRLP